MRGQACRPGIQPDAIRVQFPGQAERPIKVASNALSAMHAGIAALVNRLRSGNADGVFPHLEAESILFDARHLDDDDEVAALPKTLIGGNAPTPLAAFLSQSLSSRCSNARWGRRSASIGSANPKATS